MSAKQGNYGDVSKIPKKKMSVAAAVDGNPASAILRARQRCVGVKGTQTFIFAVRYGQHPQYQPIFEPSVVPFVRLRAPSRDRIRSSFFRLRLKIVAPRKEHLKP